MTATEHAEAIAKAAGTWANYLTPTEHAAILAAVEAAMQDARVEERTPPSDDLRAAMEALRVKMLAWHHTMGEAELYLEATAVLAAWDAQQGERS